MCNIPFRAAENPYFTAYLQRKHPKALNSQALGSETLISSSKIAELENAISANQLEEVLYNLYHSQTAKLHPPAYMSF